MSSRHDRRRDVSRERDYRDRDRDRTRDHEREYRDRDRRGGEYRDTGRRYGRSRSPPRRGERDRRRDYDHTREDRDRGSRDDRRRDEPRYERDRGIREDVGKREKDIDGTGRPTQDGRPDSSGPISKPEPRSETPGELRSGGRNGSTEPSNGVEEGEAMDTVHDDDAGMMAMMGLSGFGSTKGKHVEGNQEGSADIKRMRTWRQYMNRRGGFNRPLDKIK